MTQDQTNDQKYDLTPKPKRTEEEQQQYEKEQRAKIIATMREKGVKTLTCEYSGYNDSGEIQSITFAPEDDKDAPKDQIEDYLFAVLADNHPGYELDAGCEGTITWDIDTDKIKIDHNQHYFETLSSTTENI